MFVVIEGIDGSGKGTQTKLLKKELEDAGYDVSYFSFPAYQETVYGNLVGKYLNGELGELPIEAASTLFAVDRFEKRDALLEALATADLVLCDRWCPSNMAYSVAKKYPDVGGSSNKLTNQKIRDFARWIDSFDYEVFHQPVPDIVFHLEISPEKSAELIAKKEQRCYTDEVKDKYESDLSFQSRVAGLYSSLVSKTTRCRNWLTIKAELEDGTLRPESEISNELVLSLFRFGFGHLVNSF